MILDKESSGGRNIYGHDAGACMTVSGRDVEVTRENYENEYLPCVRVGGKRNGIGPMQLTFWALQEEADREGGCWDPRVNARVGCRHFMACVRAEGGNVRREADDYQAAYGHYRGGPRWRENAAAVAYAEDAHVRHHYWRQVINSAGGS